jgi:hypothetical protein
MRWLPSMFHGWRKDAAARALGINGTTLGRERRTHGLTPSGFAHETDHSDSGMRVVSRPASRIGLLLASLSVAALIRAPVASESVQTPNIILITIDTLRADRIGAYGYSAAHTPALDGLAARGVRFEEAMAHAPLTVPSHVSILTGQYPSRHGARDNGTFVLDARVATIASVLQERGYRTGGFVSSFLLGAGYGFDHGFARYDDELPTAGPLLD